MTELGRMRTDERQAVFAASADPSRAAGKLRLVEILWEILE